MSKTVYLLVLRRRTGTRDSLQSGIRCFFSCCGGGAKPSPPLRCPRPCPNGDQVTPGPAGRQLGGHSTVKQREEETEEDRALLRPPHPSLTCAPPYTHLVPRPARRRAEDFTSTPHQVKHPTVSQSGAHAASCGRRSTLLLTSHSPCRSPSLLNLFSCSY